MEVAGIILLALVIVVVLSKMRAGPKKKIRAKAPNKNHRISAAGKRKLSLANDFPSVSIQFGPSACQGVKDLIEQRFLADDAPSVPLLNCNSANCTCKFVHHDVRREQDEDRRAHSSLRTTLYEDSGKPERRHGGRRRSSDPR